MGNTQTTDIVLKENNIVAPVLDINFDEVNAALDAMLLNYKNVAVTEDTLKEAKDDKRKLASLRVNIDNFRKDKKKLIEAAIEPFEKNCKDLTAKVVEVEKPLQAAIDEYDNKVREEKRKKAQDAITDAIARYSLSDKYANRLVIKDKYTNLTGSYKSVKEDIENEAVALKAKQDTEEKLLAEAKGVIGSLNESLTKQFDITEFTSSVDSFIDNGDGDGFIALIKDRMSAQKALEDEIKKKAIEAEKAALEAEAKKAAEEAARAVRLAEEAKAKEEAKKEADAEEEISLPSGMSAPKAEKSVNIPSAEHYKMNFDVIGTYDDLAKFGAEMKVLCDKYHCTYSVNKENSGKIRKGAA